METSLAIYEALLQANVPSAAARNVAEKLEKDMATELATKSDLRHLEQLMNQRFTAAEQVMDARFAAFDLKLQNMESRLLIRLGGLMTALFALAGGLMALLR